MASSFDVPKRLHAAQHAAGQPDAITPADIGAAPASRFLTGTGSPEGILAAPVGTEYVDTVAATGAWRWLKKSGTGVTGWDAVGSPDTGWVPVTFQNGWTAAGHPSPTTPAIRRVGPSVLIRVRGLDGSAATSPTIATLPSWARPASADGGLVYIGSTVRPSTIYSDGTWSVAGANGQPGLGAAMTFSVTTSKPWPSSL